MGLPETMVERSTLTRKQFESLASYLKVTSGEMKLREAASERSDGGVTAGSYYRTVQQARSNVRASMATVLIGIWLGVVKVEDVRRLFELAGKDVSNLSEEDQERFSQVLNALLSKLVL
jgi:hypothetical protein